MSRVERIVEIFTGLVLFLAGAGIIYAFHAHGWPVGRELWDAGFLLLTEAYSLVGCLFMLLGLRYALGRKSFIEQWIGRSLRHLAFAVVLLSLAVLAAMMFVSK